MCSFVNTNSSSHLA